MAWEKLSYRMWIDKEESRIVWIDRDRYICGCPEFKRRTSCIHIRDLWRHLNEEHIKEKENSAQV